MFFLYEQIQEYLKGDVSNNLLKSISHDIQVPEYLAGCKALGLISYFITTPLWVMIEDKDIHILDSARYYEEITQFIDQCVNDTEDFIAGRSMLSFAHFVEDEIYRFLVKAWEHDDIVVTILKSVLPAISSVMKTLFKDFLNGGAWRDSSETVRAKTQSVPKNNKFSESVFGHVDRILREKPNTTTIAKEAIVMFSHNKTLNWLEGHCSKDALLSAARKDVKNIRKEFKRRQTIIEEKRKAMVAEKLREAEEREKRKVQRLENYTAKMIEWGLWQTEEQIDQHIAELSNKKSKLEALKAQFHFRKEVLQQRPKDASLKNVYTFSETVNGKRVELGIDELVTKLKLLIRHAYTLPQNDDDGNPILVAKKIKMKFMCDEGEKWEKGYVISKVKSTCCLKIT